ncbi:hypothetical protein GGI17_004173 [Coemansia sp. S146]|nr:hypothetical protein GGI17_004173 [Coemansia sp. S146]
MDLLKAAISSETKKRKTLYERAAKSDDANGSNKKYVRVADLEQAAAALDSTTTEAATASPSVSTPAHLTTSDQADSPDTAASNSTAKNSRNDDDDGQVAGTVSAEEAVRRLRARGEPIRLFGESDGQRQRRLRVLELSEEKSDGQRNEFRHVLAQVEAGAMLDDLRRQAKMNDDEEEKRQHRYALLAAYDVTPISLSLLRSDMDRLCTLLYVYFKRLLYEWDDYLATRPEEERRSAEGKMAAATQRQSADYLKPFFRNLKQRKLQADVLARITEIARWMLEREYMRANDEYLQLSIGNAPWPLGVTQVGIHARAARENINANKVAHVLNDETQRKWIQSIKRLMRFAQTKYPPSDLAKMHYSESSQQIKRKWSIVDLRTRDAGAVRRGPCWIEALPAELFELIFNYVSGTAAMNYIYCHREQHSQRLSLDRMGVLDRVRDRAMTQVCRRWRSLLMPPYYQYAVYNGKTNELEIPDEYLEYVRRILIHIPNGYRSFRSAARAMNWLAVEVRCKVRWLGLAMGDGATISKSEYGALAGFFPNLVAMSMDLAQVDLKERFICPAILDSDSVVRITALAFHRCGLPDQMVRARLISRAASTLEFLDTGQFDAHVLADIFWPPKALSSVRFPQLRRLYFHICGVAGSPAASSQTNRQLFPKAEELRCVVNVAPSEEGNDEGADNLRMFVESVLSHQLPELRRLSVIYDLALMIPELSPSALPALEHLLLAWRRQHTAGDGAKSVRVILGRSLDMAAGFSHLQHFSVRAPSTTGGGTLQLREQQQLTGLRTLDLRTWALSLCDLQLVLQRLPGVQNLALTLMDPGNCPHPDDIEFNLRVRRLWLGTVECKWDNPSLDSLITTVTQMVNLRELLLFKRAFQRLKTAIARAKSDDLYEFAKSVNIGQCYCDEWTVKTSTTLCL